MIKHPLKLKVAGKPHASPMCVGSLLTLSIITDASSTFQGVWTPCFFLMNVVRHTSIWVRGGGWGHIKLIKLNKIRGHLKSSHIADKRKSFHMALYPLPPSSNESVIDNGRNVRQTALRCRVQDYVKTCNRLSRPTKAFTKRSYSFKGVR